ncbi:hypothetical protein OK016_03510 [Vibrio chagasii]|nr:hypothetical protein [Vibrio chagasii]
MQLFGTFSRPRSGKASAKRRFEAQVILRNKAAFVAEFVAISIPLKIFTFKKYAAYIENGLFTLVKDESQIVQSLEHHARSHERRIKLI